MTDLGKKSLRFPRIEFNDNTLMQSNENDGMADYQIRILQTWGTPKMCVESMCTAF